MEDRRIRSTATPEMKATLATTVALMEGSWAPIEAWGHLNRILIERPPAKFVAECARWILDWARDYYADEEAECGIEGHAEVCLADLAAVMAGVLDFYRQEPARRAARTYVPAIAPPTPKIITGLTVLWTPTANRLRRALTRRGPPAGGSDEHHHSRVVPPALSGLQAFEPRRSAFQFRQPPADGREAAGRPDNRSES